ncbi:MAG: hypothetical protein J0H60_12650 [Rhizobiales bacterium]|nr:hypothetical protein [Hyphomicrobiales bacterium]
MIETLGDCWNQSVSLEMRCAWGRRDGMKTIRECAFSYQLDLMTLVATRGRDFPVSMLHERLRCPRCGSRRIRLLIGIPGNAGAVRARA